MADYLKDLDKLSRPDFTRGLQGAGNLKPESQKQQQENKPKQESNGDNQKK